jgi:hypothetical protein
MRVEQHKNVIRVTGIANESQLEMVEFVADNARAVYEVADFGCMVIVTTQLDAFMQEWNA